jgi:ABC-type Fe3+/spermidine/putrescine transport system ATPase subunit
MADRLIFMNRGTIVQTGTPEEVVAAPADEFVARSLGFKNIFHGTVLRFDEAVEVQCSLGILSATAPPDSDMAKGAEVAFFIDENGIAIGESSSGTATTTNSFKGVVTERVFRGAEYELRVQSGQGELYCLTSPDGAKGTVEPGQDVSFVIDPKAIRFLGGAAAP